MKRFIFAVLIMATPFASFADEIKPISVQLTCLEAVDFEKQIPRAFTLLSNPQFTIATVAGYGLISEGALTAATEGGAPTIEFVKDGMVNITIAGPELEVAFTQNSSLVAQQLFADVTQKTTAGEVTYNAVCFGALAFEPVAQAPQQ